MRQNLNRSITRRMQPRSRLQRTAALLSAAALAVLGTLAVAPPASASVDASCRHTHLTFNDGFSTYWTAEGVGLVGWRLYASLDVYDLCDHGGIYGMVGVYGANIRAHGGSYRLPPVAYSRSNSSAWSTAFLGLSYSYSGNGWDMFSVNTNNNIGMSKSTYFDAIKVPMYLVFGGVPGASRHETCTRGSGWSCAGHTGL